MTEVPNDNHHDATNDQGSERQPGNGPLRDDPTLGDFSVDPVRGTEADSGIGGGDALSGAAFSDPHEETADDTGREDSPETTERGTAAGRAVVEHETAMSNEGNRTEGGNPLDNQGKEETDTAADNGEASASPTQHDQAAETAGAVVVGRETGGEDDEVDDEVVEADDEIPGYVNVSPETARKLQELLGVVPTADTDEGGDLVGVSFPRRVDSTYPGTMEVNVDVIHGELTARIDDMNVDPDIQGFGVGGKLIQALADECRTRGIGVIDGAFLSQAAVQAMANTFGDDALEMFDPGTNQVLRMSTDQAIETLSDEYLAERVQMRQHKHPGAVVDPDEIERAVYIRVRLEEQ